MTIERALQWLEENRKNADNAKFWISMQGYDNPDILIRECDEEVAVMDLAIKALREMQSRVSKEVG